jgi:hypothetical protein
MIAALLLLFTGFSADDAPKDVLAFLESTAEALSNANVRGFCDKFDRGWPGYKQLHDDVEDLLARATVGASIEIVSSDGDEQKCALELDFLLMIEGVEQRHAIVKVQLARQGKKWKFVALEPADFFKFSRK